MAKKAQSTLINMLLSLTAIALVAAAALAALNAVTEEPIAIAKENKVQNAIKAVFRQVDSEGKTTDSIVYDASKMVDGTVYVGSPNENGKYKDSVVCHLAYSTEGEYKGAAVEAMDFDGFGGTLKVMVGFDAEGAVYGYSILESHETPGLGAKADKWFQKGKKGCIIGRTTDPELYVSKDKEFHGDVDAITGSTITSRAFLRCVNKAYANLQALLDK